MESKDTNTSAVAPQDNSAPTNQVVDVVAAPPITPEPKDPTAADATPPVLPVADSKPKEPQDKAMKEPKPLEHSKQQTIPKNPSTSVLPAIIATVVIVLGLAVLAVVAYMKTK